MGKFLEQEKDWIDSTWDKLNRKLLKTAVNCRDKIPYTSVNGKYDDKSETEISCWTNGFWSGLMWLMYVDTKNEEYRKTAERAEKLLDKAFKDYDLLHHDVGFMWLISSGVNYRLFKGEKSKLRTIYAANILAGRYNIKGKYIRAWNDNELTRLYNDGKGVVIIDCMMNIPLLYWASETYNDPRFKYIAMSHADTTMKNHIRPDGSSNHILVYDHETGEVLHRLSGQGYDENSAWSRGQGWAMYGFVLSYIHTGKQEYLDTAKRVADYFIQHLTNDFVPRSDLNAPEKPVVYDTSAGGLAACAMLEIAKYVNDEEKDKYEYTAINILKALEKNHIDWSDDDEAILKNGCVAYHKADAPLQEPLIYGDYYFAEALYKLRGNDLLFW